MRAEPRQKSVLEPVHGPGSVTYEHYSCGVAPAPNHERGRNMDLSSADLARWFAARDDANEPDRTPMKVLKLIYFAQAHHLAATNQPLVVEKTWAWEHGPVYTPARHIMKHSGSAPFKPDMGPPELDEATEAFLVAVDTQYGHLSAAALRNLAHRDYPYASVFIPNVQSIVIPDDSMAAFYRLPALAGRWIDHPDVVTVSEDADARMEEVDVDAVVARFRKALSLA